MEYADATFMFSNDIDSSLFPDGDTLFRLLQDGITRRFILVVRARVGTPFEQVTEAAIRPIRP